ncbi:MAG: 4-alpha-glucanotransferase [Clostridia bacterium]|nr:4-alpha-glucanotransferase [Clostridia bacterium]
MKDTQIKTSPDRKSGILLHISSLPGSEGVGTLGEEAFAFADFLHASGFSIWQVLPMGPTGYGESPYQSTSIFAGNPTLISLRTLRRDGLLDFSDDELPHVSDPGKVDFDSVRSAREPLLRRCYQTSYEACHKDVEKFEASHPWVQDYALFTSVKAHFGGIMWTQWPDQEIRNRKPSAVAAWSEKMKDEIRYHIFIQYLFDRQWTQLHDYCRKLSIRLFGDMPIYVAEDSADTWTSPKVFQLDRNRLPKRVAGVPPDYFSEDGQLWGNPLYRWWYLRLTGFSWWKARMRHMAQMYDIVRIDHFIGFANYYSIPYGAKNARIGKWVLAPGKQLFRALQREIPGLHIVAEDLGSVNARVRALIDETGFPGMKVLVFGFGSGEENPHFIGNWTKHTVVYTGTHDNDTVLGYLKRADKKEVDHARQVLHFEKLEDGPAAFVRATLASPSDTAMIAMQDLLGLDNSARMNMPSTVGGNWLWRLKVIPDPDAQTMYRKLNEETGRIHT